MDYVRSKGSSVVLYTPLSFPYIFNEVTGLTFEKGAESFEVIPSKTFALSELLNCRLTEDVFFTKNV